MSTGGGCGGGGENGGGGPCGACKFLRRKCVKGCVFAPYFDSDQGTAHFAAVHRVFGASNASKLLMRIPAHCRLDAVITLCYEALARVRDPVYGCVAHIFTLQQQYVRFYALNSLTVKRTEANPQSKAKVFNAENVVALDTSRLNVVNLQAELAYTQARISTLQRGATLPLPQLSSSSLRSSSEVACNSTAQMALFDEETSPDMVSYCNNSLDEVVEDGDLQSLAREYVSRYFPGVKFRPSTSQ
ncbi:hypothetical protein DH2020_002328 [Rehmannia glutinosa]|uniref:LOB domain-containing protein n=1 Tax=Rehmannia glutinosa TaxID=99300 RepID=A0ABR0XTF8_REHGL